MSSTSLNLCIGKAKNSILELDNLEYITEFIMGFEILNIPNSIVKYMISKSKDTYLNELYDPDTFQIRNQMLECRIWYVFLIWKTNDITEITFNDYTHL